MGPSADVIVDRRAKDNPIRERLLQFCLKDAISWYMDAFSRPISKKAARILYNVADARLGSCSKISHDFMPKYEKLLKEEGPSAARVNWLVLHFVELIPMFSFLSRKRFSSRPRAERKVWLARFERSAFGPLASSFSRLNRRLDKALKESA